MPGRSQPITHGQNPQMSALQQGNDLRWQDEIAEEERQDSLDRVRKTS